MTRVGFCTLSPKIGLKFAVGEYTPFHNEILNGSVDLTRRVHRVHVRGYDDRRRRPTSLEDYVPLLRAFVSSGPPYQTGMGSDLKLTLNPFRDLAKTVDSSNTHLSIRKIFTVSTYTYVSSR